MANAPAGEPEPEPKSEPRAAEKAPTYDEALCVAARVLRNAEMVTDLALIERLIDIADGWATIAALQLGREQASS